MARNVNRAQQTTYEALTPAQAAAVGHLLAGRSGKDTAAAVGVSEETVSRWRNGSPSFVAALNVGRHELHAAELDALRQLRRRALDTLTELLENGEDATRLRAASLVLRLDAGAPTGPQTPEQVAQDWADTRRVNLLEAVLRSNVGEPGTLVLPHAPQPE